MRRLYNIVFIEHRTILLNQLLKEIPAEGDELKIKGRKAKVLSAEHVDETRVHVQVVREALVKKQAADLSKKKRR